jgi:FtsH-binding integral membrane protein
MVELNIDRAAPRFVLTIGICIASFILMGAVDSGRRFQMISLIFAIPAIVWGPYTLITYRTKRERLVGWMAVLLAIFLLWLQFIMNLQFYIIHL